MIETTLMVPNPSASLSKSGKFTHYQTCASKNWTKTTILEYLGPKDTMIEFYVDTWFTE